MIYFWEKIEKNKKKKKISMWQEVNFMADEQKTEYKPQRSWFCVWNNPQKFFGDSMQPADMVNKAVEMWIENKPQRSCGINFEVGDSGTPHMHMVLEDPAKSTFKGLQKLFPGIHISPTLGSKKQAEDYIYKRGVHAEKNHTVVVQPVIYGTIKAAQGQRSDLLAALELIEFGKTPEEIYAANINYRRLSRYIEEEYLAKRKKDTPVYRDVETYWHFGDTGTGKSRFYSELAARYGEGSIYFCSDDTSGVFDMYMGERVVFLDEYKLNMSYGDLLKITDGYKAQLHCRYKNIFCLWNEIHITSCFSPDEVYNYLVPTDMRSVDTKEQLFRRLKHIVYHYRDTDGSYKSFEQSGQEFYSRTGIKGAAFRNNQGFEPIKPEIYQQLKLAFKENEI